MPFTCKHCQKEYTHSQSLWRHQKEYCSIIKAMSESNFRGRGVVRDEEPGARKKSKSRERGDTSVDELYEELTEDTYQRMMEDGADASRIYFGQPQQVQTALQNRFLQGRMEFQKQRTQFELLQREHLKIEAVFGPILFGVPATTTAPVPNPAPAPVPAPTPTTASASTGFNILGFGNR